MKIEHYFACQMLLRATCRRNKLNILNSNGKMVTVDPLNSDHRSSPPPKDQHMRQLPFHMKVKVDC